MPISRRACLGGAVAAVACLQYPRIARADAAVSGERRINTAGFQRTLIARIAKSACYARAGVDPDVQVARIAEDAGRFAAVHAALQHGDPRLGLAREEAGGVREALRAVGKLWLPYAGLAERVVSDGGAEAEVVDAILARDVPLYEAMNRAVQTIARRYGQDDVPLHLALAIDIAGRQRTLGVHLAKEACRVALDGGEAAAARGALAETAGLFDRSLAALREGMPMLGIRPPATPRLRARLEDVAARWAETRTTVDAIVDGAAVDAAMLRRVDGLTTALVDVSNDAVSLYELEG